MSGTGGEGYDDLAGRDTGALDLKGVLDVLEAIADDQRFGGGGEAAFGERGGQEVPVDDVADLVGLQGGAEDVGGSDPPDPNTLNLRSA